MVIERPPVSDSPTESESLGEATPAESTPVKAALGATPIEDAHTEGKNGEASPMEGVHGKALPADEVPRIVWAYHTTLQSSTMETPFDLVYGSDATAPVEIRESSPCFLGLTDGAREEAKIKVEAAKRRVERQHKL